MVPPARHDANFTMTQTGIRLPCNADAILSENRRDLEWALRPMFHALRIFGVDFNVVEKASALRRCGFTALGAAVFTCVQSSHLSRPSFERDDPVDLKSTKVWVDVLMKYVWITWYVVFSLVHMEMVALLRWKPLSARVRHLQQFTSQQSSLHGYMRKFSIALLSAVLLMVTI